MNLLCKNRLHKCHFTLTELLVVIAIFAILLALLQPSLLSALKTARMMACQNNLKSQGSAVAAYTEDYDYWLPSMNLPLIAGGSSSPYIWRWQMAPYLGLNQEYAPLTGNYWDSLPNPKWRQDYCEGDFSCPEWDITPLDNSNQARMGMGGYAYNPLVSAASGYNLRQLNRIAKTDETILIGDSFRTIFTASWQQSQFLQLFRPGQTIMGVNSGDEIAKNRHKTGSNSLWLDLHVSWNDYFFLYYGKQDMSPGAPITTFEEGFPSNTSRNNQSYYYYTKK